eukprot:1736025-Heterocapsa_arctica.AAC.1
MPLRGPPPPMPPLAPVPPEARCVPVVRLLVSVQVPGLVLPGLQLDGVRVPGVLLVEGLFGLLLVGVQ